MTQKQIAVAKNILANPSKPLGRAMLESGYSPNSATAPEKNLTSSKAWQELMDEYFPDQELMVVGEEGLHAMKPIGALVLIKNGKDGKAETILKDNEGMIEVPDHAVRHKYLETALKLKGRLKDGGNVNVGGDMNVTIIRHAS